MQFYFCQFLFFLTITRGIIQNQGTPISIVQIIMKYSWTPNTAALGTAEKAAVLSAIT